MKLPFAPLVLVLFATSCTDRAARLPHFDKIPAFQMTDANGRVFDSASMSGKVWVVDFIYTNCPAECPMMSAKMQRVQKQVAGKDDVRLLSISVDPARDSPPVLKEFAQRFGASDRWFFLTGTPETVHQLAYKTFHVGDVLGKIEHSTKFVLVDKQGVIRGYYSTLSSDGIPTMLDDLELLRGSA